MSLAKNRWIKIVRNTLDAIAMAIVIGFVSAVLLADKPVAAAGPLRDSTLMLPQMRHVQTSAISVNRMLKGDRAHGASLIQRRSAPLPSSKTAPITPDRIPVGCDPAFSAVADPAYAHVYKRCLV